jgi:hypothetical protein
MAGAKSSAFQVFISSIIASPHTIKTFELIEKYVEVWVHKARKD